MDYETYFLTGKMLLVKNHFGRSFHKGLHIEFIFLEFGKWQGL